MIPPISAGPVGRTSPSALPHMPALDGLRGLAVAGVLLFHANGALPGGFLGVDLFFVLSGYLITSLLVAEHLATGGIDLRAFWIRRARRLFPAVIALMPGIAIYALCFAGRSELASLRGDALATLGYAANWRAIWTSKSYWDLFVSPSPLEHTWSLAIEEQFYVLWPLMVLGALRVSSRDNAKRAVFILSLSLAVLSMVAMAWLLDPAKPSRVYLGTDTRASGILLGAAFATIFRPGMPVSRSAHHAIDVLGAGALVFTAWAWWSLHGDETRLYRGGFWWGETADLALIACAASVPRTWVARALAIRPLTLLGTMSYGVYLWHWPVNVVLSPERLPLGPFALNGVRLIVTFAIASASYRFLETPIRRGQITFRRPLLVVASAVVLACALVFGATFARARMKGSVPPVLAVPSSDEAVTSRLLLLGDSTANALGWAVRRVRPRGLAVDLQGENAFNLIEDDAFPKPWSSVVAEAHPDTTIVTLSGAFLYGVTFEGEWRHACTPLWDERFRAGLKRRLTDLVTVAPTAWVTTVPYALGPWESADVRRQVDCVNASIRGTLPAFPGLRLLDLAAIECPNGACERTYRGKAIRKDGVHYDIEGAEQIAREVMSRTGILAGR